MRDVKKDDVPLKNIYLVLNKVSCKTILFLLYKTQGLKIISSAHDNLFLNSVSLLCMLALFTRSGL